MRGRNGSSYLWLVSGVDKYELPMFVSDNTKEVADYLGITVTTLFTKFTKYGNDTKYRGRNYQVEKVKV